jgi:hypothetical protein
MLKFKNFIISEASKYKKEVPKDAETGLPSRYVSGLSTSTAKARAVHWNKTKKMDSKNPDAYTPAPGDKNVKTKESKYTKAYREKFDEGTDNNSKCMKCNQKTCKCKSMDEETSYSAKEARAGKDIGKPGKNFEKISKSAAKRYGSKEAGERVAGAILAKLRKEELNIEQNYIDEETESGLAKKSKESGISIGTLKKVYNRGMAAWRTGHRPGTTPQQWAMARVNSYITKGKTYHTADKDLHEEDIEEALYHGKEVPLNKPMKGDVKKSKVYVRDPDTGNVVKVNFGDKNLSIKKHIPARKKSYCARSSGQGNLRDKTSANYWSRKAWDCN